jgi:hypothetical protein
MMNFRGLNLCAQIVEVGGPETRPKIETEAIFGAAEAVHSLTFASIGVVDVREALIAAPDCDGAREGDFVVGQERPNRYCLPSVKSGQNVSVQITYHPSNPMSLNKLQETVWAIAACENSSGSGLYQYGDVLRVDAVTLVHR